MILASSTETSFFTSPSNNMSAVLRIPLCFVQTCNATLQVKKIFLSPAEIRVRRPFSYQNISEIENHRFFIKIVPSFCVKNFDKCHNVTQRFLSVPSAGTERTKVFILDLFCVCFFFHLFMILFFLPKCVTRNYEINRRG